MEYTTMQTHRERPLGVSIIAVLEGLGGLFWVAIGVIALVASYNVPSTILSTIPYPLSAYVSIGDIHTSGAALTLGIVGGVLVIGAVIELLLARGLWRLKHWAFWLTVVIQFLSLLGSIFAFLQPEPNVGGIVLGIVIPAIILAYFLADANVRAAFRL